MATNMDDRKYWLSFSLIPEIGPKRLEQLHNWFGNLEHAWRAPEADLRRAGLDREPVANIIAFRPRIDPDEKVDKLARMGIGWLTRIDDDYPTLLRTVPDAPPILYWRGTISAVDERALAIVGTRRASRYGKEAASRISHELAQQGVTIISGMAHGIDAAAHEGALKVRGRTLAVLGCGVNIVYPADHHKLADEIIETGALISEFPPGTPPDGKNFPRRNRLISGLSSGVLVVEAPKGSGALITAALAAEQGRDVFAIPGNIYARESWGPNRLIQDGATLVIGVEDILDELDATHAHIQTQQTAQRLLPGNETEARLLAQLDMEPIHIDDLVRLTGLPTATVSSTLTMLELKGLAQTAGAMQYCRTYQK